MYDLEVIYSFLANVVVTDGYQYEFFFAMTEENKDKLEVDKLYVALKQSFSIIILSLGSILAWTY